MESSSKRQIDLMSGGVLAGPREEEGKVIWGWVGKGLRV